jgi:uncharacterized protein YodC (DUF2158 family)
MTQVPYQPKPGDVVRVKSGGPKMTVIREAIAREGVSNVWECAWFVELKELRTGDFPAITLERTE